MSSGESMTGTGFEILFKSICSAVVSKTNSNNYLPWFVFCSMGRLAGIMFFKAVVQIRCDSDISFSGFCQTLEKVDILNT